MILDKSSYHRLARKTWEAKFGKRPFDKNGARFHIHHIDGDHTNNDVDNLFCVSPETHRVLHNGKSVTVTTTDLVHVDGNTVPEFIDLNDFKELVNALVDVMTAVGMELDANQGHRDGWEDIVRYPDDALDDDVYDVVTERAYRFIFTVAYPVALNEFHNK